MQDSFISQQIHFMAHTYEITSVCLFVCLYGVTHRSGPLMDRLHFCKAEILFADPLIAYAKMLESLLCCLTDQPEAHAKTILCNVHFNQPPKLAFCFTLLELCLKRTVNTTMAWCCTWAEPPTWNQSSSNWIKAHEFMFSSTSQLFKNWDLFRHYQLTGMNTPEWFLLFLLFAA